MKYISYIFILFPFICYSQTNRTLEVGLNYGTLETLSFEMIYSIDTMNPNIDIPIGLGISLPFESYTFGTDYSNQLYFPFEEDIYEVGKSKDVGFYLILGVNINRFSFGGRLGLYSNSDYYNAVNNIMGAYFTTNNTKEKIFGGGFVGYKVFKSIGLKIGYDNYNETTVGLNYSF